jgi:hypothetical protein
VANCLGFCEEGTVAGVDAVASLLWQVHWLRPTTTTAMPLRGMRLMKHVLAAAGAFAATAGLCVVPLWTTRPVGGGWERLPLIAIGCSGAVAALLWWLGVVRPGSTASWRGALTGLGVVITSHVLSWYVMSVLAWLIDRRDSLGEPLLGPVEALPGAFVFAAMSLALVPWSLPAGALVGVFLVRQQR